MNEELKKIKRKITITLEDTDMVFEPGSKSESIGVTCQIDMNVDPEFDEDGKVINGSPALKLLDEMLHAANATADQALSWDEAVKACGGHAE